MIIDDKPYMSSLISEDLSREGHTLACFEDAVAAMDEFPFRMPDIVLLDLYFKGFENWDTLRSMKARYPDLPVIIFSAYKNFLDDPRIDEADGYVIKNIYTGELKNKIQEVLTYKNILERNA